MGTLNSVESMHQHFCRHRVILTQHKNSRRVMLVYSIKPNLVVYDARANNL